MLFESLYNKTFDLILGDFNINALDDETFQPLKNILNSYEMVVREPTHLDGGLLDNVYIRKMFLRKELVLL